MGKDEHRTLSAKTTASIERTPRNSSATVVSQFRDVQCDVLMTSSNQ